MTAPSTAHWPVANHRELPVLLRLPDPASADAGAKDADRLLAATLAAPADWQAPQADWLTDTGPATTLPPPAAEPTRHGVVVLHGWGGPRAGPGRLLLRLSRRLAGQGCLVLRPDLPGRGEADGSPDDTDLDGMIRAAVFAARRLREDCGCGKISLVGMCSGANVAIGAATAEDWPAAPTRMVLISLLPFVNPLPASGPVGSAGSVKRPASAWARRWFRLREYGRKALSPDTWKRLWRGEIDWRGVMQTFSGSSRGCPGGGARRNPKDSLRNIPRDWSRNPAATETLLVYGAADPEAPTAMDYYRELSRRSGLAMGMTQVSGADHNFSSAPWADTAIDAVVGWLAKSV